MYFEFIYASFVLVFCFSLSLYLALPHLAIIQNDLNDRMRIASSTRSNLFYLLFRSCHHISPNFRFNSFKKKSVFANIRLFSILCLIVNFSYVIATSIKGTDVSVFSILDGHGGEFAAVFAKDRLMELLSQKIVAVVDVSVGRVRPLPHRRNSIIAPPPGNIGDMKKNETDGGGGSGGGGSGDGDDDKNDQTKSGEQVQRTPSQRRKLTKTLSTDNNDCDPANNTNCHKDQDAMLNKLSSIRIAKESFMKKDKAVRPNQYEAGYYVDRNNKINFGKLITDLVLLTDYELIETAKKEVRLAPIGCHLGECCFEGECSMNLFLFFLVLVHFTKENVAGSTLLLAILHKTQLVVANVGDSRGVMCDAKGNVIPMSFDHKPQQSRELKRIQKAGGFVQFKGVWRVAGILATSRALGDYPLKEKNYVIAEPDILTFELANHK